MNSVGSREKKRLLIASWNEYYPKIVDQARMEKGTRVSNAITELLDDDEGKQSCVHVLCFSSFFKRTWWVA